MSAARSSPRCPKCRRPTRTDSEHFPFCSQRCRLLDLGDWLNAEFRLPGEKVDPRAVTEGNDEKT